MRRLARALRHYIGSRLAWRTCWRHANDEPRFRIVADRDGFLYVEPKPMTTLRLARHTNFPGGILTTNPPQDIQ